MNDEFFYDDVYDYYIKIDGEFVKADDCYFSFCGNDLRCVVEDTFYINPTFRKEKVGRVISESRVIGFEVLLFFGVFFLLFFVICFIFNIRSLKER